MKTKVELVKSAGGNYFTNTVNKTIEEFYREGYSNVKIQYQPIASKDEYEYILYTALIIGER